MKTSKTYHPRKVTFFALLSVSDLYLTWRLLQGGGGQIYESNPIAGAWLESYSWGGLITFKALAMLLVLLSALYVSYREPRTGGRLLGFGCFVTGAVVAYSIVLLTRPAALALPSPEEEEGFAARQADWLNHQLQREKDYSALLGQLAQRLAAGSADLADAVQQLADSEKGHDPCWIRRLRERYGLQSQSECLAMHLSVYALGRFRDAGGHWPTLARALETAFHERFGASVDLGQAARLADEAFGRDHSSPPPSHSR